MLRVFESEYKSIPEAVHDHAMTQGQKICLIDSTDRVTYAELYKKVLQVHSFLRNIGVKKSEAVLVECDQSANYFAVLLGVELYGAVFVPIEMLASELSIKRIADEVDAKVLISERSLQLAIKQYRYEQVFDSNSEQNEKVTFPHLDAVAEILFTTGSTGQSKGIVLTHKNNVAIAQNVIYGVKTGEDNIEMIPTPTSHSHGLRRTYANLLNGSTAILLDGVMNLKAFFSYLDREDVTAIDLTPSAFQIIHKLSKNRLAEYNDKLEYIQFGSAKLLDRDKETLRDLLPDVRLYDFYGSTEAGCSCIFDFNEDKEKKNCIGKPTYNSEFVTIDPVSNTLFRSSQENLGLIASRGHMLMKGYWKQDDLTASVMSEGYLLSNDLGYIDDEGFVYMMARNDFVINYAGIKINPDELESVLFNYSEFQDCAVVGMPDSLSGEVPVILYTVKDNSDIDSKVLQKFISENIDINKQPKKFIEVDRIPRAQNGKILRKQLYNLVEDDNLAKRNYK